MISLLWSTLLWAQEFPKKLLQARDQSMGLEIPERINMISQSLRGIPYLFNPEGEETGVDSDPMWNFAHMDCLTYVEAVLAFSISDNVIEALEVRNDLRYLQDEIHYQNRKHFMFTQWIPHNLELGYIQEITGEIGNTRNIVRSYDAKIWNNWRSRKKIFLEEDNYPIGDFSLEVLSPQEALDQIEHIPSGSILIVVRDSGWGNPIMVSHIGFVIRNKKNQIKMRHATTMGSPKGVKEHTLKWYLKHLRDYPYRWKVAGVSIFYPKYPGDHGLDHPHREDRQEDRKKN